MPVDATARPATPVRIAATASAAEETVTVVAPHTCGRGEREERGGGTQRCRGAATRPQGETMMARG